MVIFFPKRIPNKGHPAFATTPGVPSPGPAAEVILSACISSTLPQDSHTELRRQVV